MSGSKIDAVVREELVVTKPSKALVRRARELRGRGTEAEVVFWEVVRDRRLAGVKFRRQHPIGRFAADFYCEVARLVVEIDGMVHAEPDQVEQDRVRKEILRANNLRVLRFTNEQVLRETEDVVTAIRSVVGGEGRDQAGQYEFPCDER